MSIGVDLPTDGTDAKTLMINADAAFIAPKPNFVGRRCSSSPKWVSGCTSGSPCKGITTAIDRGELLLHYQPQKKMSGEPSGLKRWPLAMSKTRHGVTDTFILC